MSFRILAGVIIDGKGEQPLRDGVIEVTGDRIAGVSLQEGSDPYGTWEVIDLRGMTLLPGFVDLHAHLIGVTKDSLDTLRWPTISDSLAAVRAAKEAETLLMAGFTTVRDVGSWVAMGIRDAINEGSVVGPRIFAAGPLITQTGGHGDGHFFPLEVIPRLWKLGRIADGPDACRRVAREILREGADLLKICTTGGIGSQKDHPKFAQFTLDEIRSMVEEAVRVGKRVAAHAQSDEGIVNAIRGGVHTIEHAIYCSEETCALLAESHTIVVPTLAVIERLYKRGNQLGVPEWWHRKVAEARDSHRESIARAYQMGVTIGLGTDFLGGSHLPHGENAEEFELLVDVGLSPMDAICAGTRNAAQALGNKDIGILEPGRLADIVAVKGDPLRDISTLREVGFVMKGGTVVKHQELPRGPA